MKRLNRSHLLSKAGETDESPNQNKSFSEGNFYTTNDAAKACPSLVSLLEGGLNNSKRLLNTLSNKQNRKRESIYVDVNTHPFIRENKDGRIQVEPAILSAHYDDDSFIKERMVEIKLKRTATPHLELPQLEDDEGKSVTFRRV